MSTEYSTASQGATGLAWLTARGNPFEIGFTLGRHGRRAVHGKLMDSQLWETITGPGYAMQVERMLDTTRRQLPWVLEEIRGLAQGLALPLRDVFAWNCRGDLLASCPDGCTTVILPGDEPCIAHNEDGLPLFDGDAFLANVRPDDQPAFLALCYPGSIPGHTFALTQNGIVQTVNNLRLDNVIPEIPRMVLGRDMLSRTSLDNIVDFLSQAPASGGFHFTLAQHGIPSLYSVEIGGRRTSSIHIETPSVHANHALHHDCRNGNQIVTRSSRDRQRRGSELIAAGVRDPLAILKDTGGDGLPIYRREADDPDHENTLATGIFRLLNDRIEWEVHTPRDRGPIHGTDQSLFA
ncbi:C45 family autoproteolytic acyltransferase/hydolase [Billgrantia endophytica]|uniref:6-aminopenicillanic acid acyl-transferase n=1 Tax=Billgrantia endophytica TaxID=2033802 RepID=A0A2N7U417_9GAMM|nr:C45 family peptidase [Halomonas endophytica]PMR75178.1 6-aminopenicillanic acid acyl-transferase [Halomonas endophytica]